MLCLVRYSCQRRADHSSSEVLPSVVCLTECDREASTVRGPELRANVVPRTKNKPIRCSRSFKRNRNWKVLLGTSTINKLFNYSFITTITTQSSRASEFLGI